MGRLRAAGNQVQLIAWGCGVAATCVSGVANRRTHTRVPDQASVPQEMDTMSLPRFTTIPRGCVNLNGMPSANVSRDGRGALARV